MCRSFVDRHSHYIKAKVPQQPDSVNCGLFSVECVKRFLEEKPDVASQSSPPRVRTYVDVATNEFT